MAVRSWLWLGLAAATLSGCQKDFPVTVTQSGGDVFIEVAARSAGARARPPCVRLFGIMDPEGGAIWWSEAPGGCTERTRFKYGEVPEGWRTRGPAPRLVPGQRYQVMVGLRNGRVGSTIFRYED